MKWNITKQSKNNLDNNIAIPKTWLIQINETKKTSNVYNMVPFVQKHWKHI